MSDVRVERDGLGVVELPAQALYGIQTARALENLSFSKRTLGSCPVYVRALAVVKGAAARANREAGVLDTAIADAIESAARTALDHLDQFPVDLLGGGGSIAVNMNVNEVLANLANLESSHAPGAYEPVHPLRHVNASQSTADVCHTAVRLAILDGAGALTDAVDAAAKTLAAKAAAYAAIPTLSRTCLQDALPTTVDVLLGGHAALLARRGAALAAAFAPLRSVALGGTVIGSGDGAPPAYRDRVVAILAERSGYALEPADSRPDRLQNSDDVAALSAQLALLAEALLKVAQDLRLLASGPQGGFGELTLPHVQAGSSFFAAKSNPVVAESAMQCAIQVLGCNSAVQAACARAELHLNVFDGLATVNVLDAIDMLTAVLQRFEQRCLRGLEINEARCRELARTT